jgi:hypothetical protein
MMIDDGKRPNSETSHDGERNGCDGRECPKEDTDQGATQGDRGEGCGRTLERQGTEEVTDTQLYIAIGLPTLAVVTSLIVSLVQISGIREDIREIRNDMKLLGAM